MGEVIIVLEIALINGVLIFFIYNDEIYKLTINSKCDVNVIKYIKNKIKSNLDEIETLDEIEINQVYKQVNLSNDNYVLTILDIIIRNRKISYILNS